MPGMGTYTVYRLDGVGRIRGSEWLDALNDRFALKGARALAAANGWQCGCELWLRERMVAHVPPCSRL